ncbi:MAG: hypothetical protein KatS3mg112_0569 [Thermogutta sp.]|nr:MAG: hypothetical protein KatS3mg112_0569 [Thermogutta sp.]
MLVVTCPSCLARLKVSPQFTGRAGKCPRCGEIVPIRQSEQTPPSSTPVGIAGSSSPSAGDDDLPDIEHPDRLVRHFHYLVCDRQGLVATWESNGQGWMIRSGTTFVRAVRNADKLPAQGDFKLVELQIEPHADGSHRLDGLHVYQLAPRYALTRIERGEDAILGAIRGPGSLNREQKAAVFRYIREKFMRPMWENNQALIDYLTNQDYHSPGISPPTHPASPA